MTGRRAGNVENRRSNFKFNAMTTDELRRRREETQVELRKAKREDVFSKRRNLVESTPTTPPLTSPTQATLSTETLPAGRSKNLSAAELSQRLPNMVQGVYSADLATQRRSATDFRKILSSERNPPIQEVINCGVVPRFVEMLAGKSGTATDDASKKLLQEIQFESAWVLTNIASGASEHTMVVAKCNAVPIFIQLLYHENVDIREQCIWALGNIAGDGVELRDYVLKEGILSPLLSNVQYAIQNASQPISTIRNGAWTISNLCRGNPAPNWGQIADALPVLYQLIQLSDEEALVDTCWALAYMSVEGNGIEGLISSQMVPLLAALLKHKNEAIQMPALRAVGNVVTGTDQQTQTVIDAGALSLMRHLLNHSKTSIIKETCWTISNITAGTPSQIQAVIDANLIPPLIHLLSFADFKVKKEACWAICNATAAYNDQPNQVKYLVRQGCIKPLCDILSVPDSSVVLVALDGLNNILSVGDQESQLSPDNINPYAQYVEEAGGLDTIVNLQSHAETGIYLKAKGIIDKYFEGEDEEEPEIDASGAFHFNTQNAMPQGGFKFA